MKSKNLMKLWKGKLTLLDISDLCSNFEFVAKMVAFSPTKDTFTFLAMSLVSTIEYIKV